MTTMMNHPQLLIGTLSAILLFHLTGYLVIRYVLTELSTAYHLALALPAGIFIWSMIWIAVTLATAGSGFGFNNLANVYTLAVAIITMPVFLYLNFMKQRLTSLDLSHLFMSIVLLMLLTTFFFIKGWAVVTGDSYFFLNWAVDPAISLELGYPLVLLSIANLSTLIGPDYFLYVIHPLTTLCLIVLVFLSIDSLCSRYNILRDKRLKFLFLIIVMLIYSMNPMVHLQMAYVNHHTFFTILVLTLVILPFIISTFHLNHYIFIGFLALAATLTRMEGFLFFIVMMAIMAWRFQDRLNGFKLFLLTLLCCSPYLLYLTGILWDKGFVSGIQYLMMLSAGFIIMLMSTSQKLKALFREWDPGNVAIALLFVALLVVTLFEPAHMVHSLIMFARNSITPGAWGALNILLLILVPLLLYLRKKGAESKKYYDIFLQLFVISVLLMLIITFLRSPLRIGRFDSANRMLFHFIPLITVWVSIELGKYLEKREGELE